MESYRLDSRIVEDDKEFLIQTVNDTREGIIKTSLFANGELLDSSIMPHSEEMGEPEILELIKATHGEKKSELEYLLKSFKEVIAQGRPEMMFHLGTALYYKRMYTQARQLFQSAVKLKHDYHEAFYYLAQAETALGHVEPAIKAGVRAVELRPNFADYRNALGEAYLAAGSCKRALIEFDEAIRQNIYYADAYFNLALTYILNAVTKEDFNLYADLAGKTSDLLKKAVLIYPGYKSAPYDEAIASLNNKELKRAYMLLKGAREAKKEQLRRERSSYFHRFLIYTDWIAESNLADRIKLLENEINRNPGYVDLYYDLGICYLHQARFNWQKSTDYFKKTLEINPKLLKAQRSLDLCQDYYLKLSDAIVDISEKHG